MLILVTSQESLYREREGERVQKIFIRMVFGMRNTFTKEWYCIILKRRKRKGDLTEVCKMRKGLDTEASGRLFPSVEVSTGIK